MKNKKLNLNELKVKSFVTDLENGKENTVKGGAITVEVGCTMFPICTWDGCGIPEEH